jgi:hypothetical protein
MRGGIRQFDYNHKVDKLVSTHPLGDFICVRCKTERFEVGTKKITKLDLMHVGMIVMTV